MTWAFTDPECLGLATSHGTPLFAYREAVVAHRYASLRAALPPQVRVACAVKANAHPGQLRCFATLGASFDCASMGELRRVQALPDAGPGLLRGSRQADRGTVPGPGHGRPDPGGGLGGSGAAGSPDPL